MCFKVGQWWLFCVLLKSAHPIANKQELLSYWLIVVINHCFTSLFGTKDLLSDIVIR